MKYLFSLFFCLTLSLTSRADDYIVVVLDTSGSMNDWMRSAGKSRIQVAKESLVNVLTDVPASTKVGVLTFDNWVYDLGAVDKEVLTRSIMECPCKGGTPLYKYVKLGADRLLQERAKNLNIGYYKLIIVTDGEAQDGYLNRDDTYSDGSTKPGYIKDIVNRGIVVDAIGLEMKNDHTIKSEINGIYMRGDDPSSISRSIKSSVAEVGYGKNKDVAEEAFAVINCYPNEFIKASIDGLSRFQNQPIGDLPLVEVVNEDGSITYEKNPLSTNNGLSFFASLILAFIFSIAFGLALAFVLVILFKKSN